MRTIFSRTNCLSLIVCTGILLSYSLLFVGIASADTVIFQNENTLAVRNSPQQATIFRTTQPFKINTIRTYHWNNGRGTPSPGTISLTASDGKKYGPWNAAGSPGQGKVPNANWITKPNVVIPAGQYTVIDSSPATWSHTGGAGFAYVSGDPVPPKSLEDLLKSAPPPQPPSKDGIIIGGKPDLIKAIPVPLQPRYGAQ